MNASEVGNSAPDDPRIVWALEEYAAAVEAGCRPNRQQFQARYPDIAAELAACLEGLEFIEAAAPQLAHPAAGQLSGSNGAVEFWPAESLGDFRIVAEIGRGGMGVVYEVIQTSLGRRVALKVLPLAAALDSKQLQRFKNEAQAAAQLHHQNIVPVYGVGCDRGVYYYAMQFIDGQTLSALVAELRSLAGLDKQNAQPVTLAAASLAADLVTGRWAPAGTGAVQRNSFLDGLPRLNSDGRGGTAWEGLGRPGKAGAQGLQAPPRPKRPIRRQSRPRQNIRRRARVFSARRLTWQCRRLPHSNTPMPWG